MKSSVYVIGTMDTKGRELDYVGEQVRVAGADAILVDVGTREPPQCPADVSRETVASFHPQGCDAVLSQTDRGRAVAAMSEALQRFLLHEFASGKVAGAIGIGGTGGTALISSALRALPIGLPKILVSTVASGNTLPYVGTSDIAMMNAVVDVAGLNRVSRKVLGNAAHAIAGMARHSTPPGKNQPTVGLTMFGVTTPCVNQVREGLEALGWDCLVFHATGTGGQAMEKLASSGMIEALLDLTTTEVADEVVGGVFRAGPDRFDLLAQREIPCVMSLGALDMVNFGARETVPEPFRDRKLHVHNANVTLMRTTVQENRAFARWMAPKLNRARGPLTILIPERGISMLDAPGQPFHDPEADAALFEELEKLLETTKTRRILRLPHHINDPAFAEAALREFNAIAVFEKKSP
ncbi:MAG: Tm-1-like ATP-binding domain-containing protein [Methylacidiphilales bacterium]|nr:Tm-1-like ATP-binding domain-containing protein [Candidatus Methylacidiphilales bacterium]